MRSVPQSMTSRRYQSQFFKFVTQQTQKLADKSATLLRHAKVTAIWTTQILLYPIYATFQGTRAIGQQIGRTVEKAVLRLRMSREEITTETNLSDAPIQNVLTAVKRALVSGGNLPVLRERHPLVLIGRFLMRREETSIASNPYHIQGIACAVDTHKFVLILEDNVIFDILTPEQQQQIEHRIRLELARYWQWKRKLYLKSAPLGLTEDRETLLPPIRVFRQLMAWVQTSPVAIAINLFQEAEIIEQPGELDWFIPSVPLSAWNPGTLIPKAPSPRNITSWFAQLPNLSDLEALIWAAIHYFFGERTRFSPAHEALSGTTSTNLGFRHLFRVSGREAMPKGTAKLPAPPETLILEGTATGFGEARSFSFAPSLKQKIQEYLRKLSGVIVHQKKVIAWEETSIVISQTEEIVTQPRSSLINLESNPTEIISTQTNTLTVEAPEPFEVETAFDWIETPVNQSEYVLTPWQKFLQSIDSGFLWIEQHIILFWRWLTRWH
ncbi:hypothetical protein LEP3755_00320 [Leptolyngbya sp. NIES-3755]|nr:hypothetical protein LEP3755_00320 [Leptolyngbya sp. NIES-3755]